MASGASISATGYVLHMRPFRESGALCDLFTLEQGRLTAVAHGVRGRRGSSAPQAFNCHALQLHGKGELKTLRRAEAMEARWLKGTALAAGMYLNELLVRLLPREDPHERLFVSYGDTLRVLAGENSSAAQLQSPEALGVLDVAAVDVALRGFERVLLEELGYGLPLDLDHLGQAIDSTGTYRLEPSLGFVDDAAGAFSGSVLLAISCGDLDDVVIRRAARRLFNAMLAPHLDGRPIQSRVLLQGRRQNGATHSD